MSPKCCNEFASDLIVYIPPFDSYIEFASWIVFSKFDLKFLQFLAGFEGLWGPPFMEPKKLQNEHFYK